MTIKRKLIITCILSLLFSLMVIVILLTVSASTGKSLRNHRLAHTIHKEVSELNILTFKYLAHPQEVLENEWEAKYQTISRVLSEADREIVEQPFSGYIRRTQSDFIRLYPLFSHIVRASCFQKSATETALTNDEYLHRWAVKEETVANMLILTQSILTNSSGFLTDTIDNVFDYLRTYQNIIIFSLIILILTLTAIPIFFVGSISTPLINLARGVGIIGGGNLDYQVGVETNDEIGQLSRAFNQMAHNLKKITASRNELNVQIRNRKRLEADLRESEIRYRGLVEGTDNLIVRLDKAGRLMYINPTGSETFGAGVRELIGEPVNAFFHADDLPRTKMWLKTCIARKMPKSTIENRVVNRQTGGLFHLLWTARFIYDDKKELINIDCIAYNVTEIIKAEKALRESEHRLSKLNNCFLNFGSDSEENIARLTAIPGELLKGMFACYSSLNGDHLTLLGGWNLPADYEKTMDKSGLVCSDVIRRDHQDVTIINALIMTPYMWTDPRIKKYAIRTYMGKAVRCGNRAVGALSVVFDDDRRVTPDEIKMVEIIASAIGIEEERIQKEKERSALENKLRQSQKIEAIGRLAGGIAHDFNNILAIIIGNTELAMEGLPTGTPVREYLSETHIASLRARELIRHILDFSRKSSPKKKPVNLVALIEESSRLMRASLPTTIEIEKKLYLQSAMVSANATQINQVLLNLITNGAHAMNFQGRLNVYCREYRVENGVAGLPKGNYAHISVADTGCGIDQAHMDKIFDPYFTTKDIGEGSGLGLSVAYGIIESHKGMITAISDPGKGTTFNVYLPLIETGATTEPVTLQPVPKGTGTILFVDDEAMLTRMGKRILTSLGYSVVAKESAVDALQHVKDHAAGIDLVITDMTMPVLSGHKLAHEILSIRPDMPIILCTGYSEQINQKAARELGVRKFLFKPLTTGNLAHAIFDVLGDSHTHGAA